MGAEWCLCLCTHIARVSSPSPSSSPVCRSFLVGASTVGVTVAASSVRRRSVDCAREERRRRGHGELTRTFTPTTTRRRRVR